MRLPGEMRKRLIEEILLRSSTDNTGDIERLAVTEQIVDTGVRNFLNAFARDSHEETAVSPPGERGNRKSKEKLLLRNLIFRDSLGYKGLFSA